MASKGATVDKKTETTLRTVENLKASGNVFQDFIKTVQGYQKASQKLADEGKKLADALQRLSQLPSGDLGDGIAKLAEHHRQVEMKREVFIRSLQDDLISSLQKTIKPEESELSAFESDYKKTRAAIRAQVTKLEAQSKKAGKKGPEVLKQAIASLDAKIKEADQIKGDKLRTVLLLERKKYCNFLTFWNSVIQAEVDLYDEASHLKDYQSSLATLASSNQQLPPDAEQLINSSAQERTFVQIQGGDYGSEYGSEYGGEYGSGDYGSTDYGLNDYGSSTDFGGGYGGGGGGLGTATALYDFAGEQESDLSFYAGDIITILAEDDGSGWLTGELNGQSGIFPSSYVQR